MTVTGERVRAPGGLGHSAARPDGVPKVSGTFAFSSDLFADGMVWGHVLRSPHPYARIRSVDIGPALAMAGVHAVLTADDVPGDNVFGLEHADQPVFARDLVRFTGEAVAAIAADHPDTARRAAEAIVVDYEPLDPLVDAEAAIEAPPIHPDGNVFRHLVIRHGDVAAEGDVVVEGTYDVGMQDQAFMGPESGLAVPDGMGGVDLQMSTQWLHVDRDQVAACLGPRARPGAADPRRGRRGVRRARGRQHAGAHLPARAAHRPSGQDGVHARGVVPRPRAPSPRAHALPPPRRPRRRLVKVEARLVLDGGAYASTSGPVLVNACCFAAGPYAVPNALIEGWAVRTNNPPCGAMRGFGAVQACFGHESQMDKLAAALGLDPVELRLRNAMKTGDCIPTGQVVSGAAPVEELIRTCAAAPLPPLDPSPSVLSLPGGSGRVADPSRVRRGVGFAVGFKNLMYSAGFDDYSTARVRLEDGVATVTCAAAEVGQGFVTLAQQIVREVLDIDDVRVAPAETVTIGSAGSTSASRQTWMSGGAVERAALAVRARLDAGETGAIEETYEHHHPPTSPLDADGQGDAHVSYVFAAHRAVVDVDLDLGLVRVVEIATSQDVGRVLNPLQVTGPDRGRHRSRVSGSP